MAGLAPLVDLISTILSNLTLATQYTEAHPVVNHDSHAFDDITPKLQQLKLTFSTTLLELENHSPTQIVLDAAESEISHFLQLHTACSRDERFKRCPAFSETGATLLTAQCDEMLELLREHKATSGGWNADSPFAPTHENVTRTGDDEYARTVDFLEDEDIETRMEAASSRHSTVLRWSMHTPVDRLATDWRRHATVA